MCGRLRVGKSFFHILQHWSVQPCVGPFDAVHMLRGSGPGQNLAFDDALALVGCPDRTQSREAVSRAQARIRNERASPYRGLECCDSQLRSAQARRASHTLPLQPFDPGTGLVLHFQQIILVQCGRTPLVSDVWTSARSHGSRQSHLAGQLHLAANVVAGLDGCECNDAQRAA